MSDNYREQAKELADHYLVNIVSLEETTDGNQIYIARSLELPGCLAQGYTIEEALRELKYAQVDYIESLLEDGLSVPEAGTIQSTTSTNPIIFESTTYSKDVNPKRDDEEYKALSVGAFSHT